MLNAGRGSYANCMERARAAEVGGKGKGGGVAAGAPLRRRLDSRSEPRRGQEEGVWG
jgi:hypothetical protein